MSWVFMTEDRVYKLKKPVRYPHLDHTTLERRKQSCEEELRLNRRLAPEIYLAVLPLCLADGDLVLGGSGDVVEWVLEMVRLPESAMLDVLITIGGPAPTEIERLGGYLADFYAAAPEELDGAEPYLARLSTDLRLDGESLLRPEFGLEVTSVLDAAAAALAEAAPVVRERAKRGLIVEGHGDLRPEHVCLTEPPQIFDCLEFDRVYRVLDPYDEAAYLGIECEVLGAGWIGPALVDCLSDRLGDPPPESLLVCYGALSALTRARLCLAHLLETPVRLPEKWRPLALRYLAAADVRLNIGQQSGCRHGET
jgi:aminoglycoside phosphotransferase family enzyme